VGRLYKPTLPAAVDSGDSLEISYWSHFQRHVRHLLPTASLLFTDGSLRSLCLRSAVLCISASNLSMLNARVQSRSMAGDNQRSVFSPLVNNLHHSQAQKYHDQALWHCRMAEAGEVECQASAVLAAHTLLAYYHHASTNHLKFRLAVWDSVRYVLRNRDNIMGSTDGADSLQMWYRLCISHRLAKPPALLLEGEGASSFGPNRFPDAMDHIYLSCIRGMSVDDLIYDILIKSLEIRTRLIVFRCVASRCHISELSSEIGSITHDVLSKMLGRDYTLDECAEAREGFCARPASSGVVRHPKGKTEGVEVQAQRGSAASPLPVEDMYANNNRPSCFIPVHVSTVSDPPRRYERSILHDLRNDFRRGSWSSHIR
jgi:hypothetical protein